jgi:hypothetical protein
MHADRLRERRAARAVAEPEELADAVAVVGWVPTRRRRRHESGEIERPPVQCFTGSPGGTGHRPSPPRRALQTPYYSPELNGIEGIWKVTKKTTTHNRFYRTVDERDAALVATFETFKAYPDMIAGHFARFL